jgi:hypothetical protein
MKHLVIGVISAVLGLIGLIVWWKTFGLVMRGVIPFTMLLLGVVAILSGMRRISSGQDSEAGLESKSEEDDEA